MTHRVGINVIHATLVCPYMRGRSRAPLVAMLAVVLAAEATPKAPPSSVDELNALAAHSCRLGSDGVILTLERAALARGASKSSPAAQFAATLRQGLRRRSKLKEDGGGANEVLFVSESLFSGLALAARLDDLELADVLANHQVNPEIINP